MALVKMIPVLIIFSYPLLLFRHLLHLIRRQNCGLTTGQDSAHLWWPVLYLSNSRHKFSSSIYKQLANLAAQQIPSKNINELTMLEIVDFIKEQFDPSSSGVTSNGNQAKLFRSWQRVYVKTRLPVTFFRSKTHKTKLCARDSYALSTTKLS